MERFADELDLAQMQTDQMIESAVGKVRRQVSEGQGRKDCCECGAIMPTARLMLVPNATRCAPCQEQYEQQRTFQYRN